MATLSSGLISGPIASFSEVGFRAVGFTPISLALTPFESIKGTFVGKIVHGQKIIFLLFHHSNIFLNLKDAGERGRVTLGE